MEWKQAEREDATKWAATALSRAGTRSSRSEGTAREDGSEQTVGSSDCSPSTEPIKSDPCQGLFYNFWWTHELSTDPRSGSFGAVSSPKTPCPKPYSSPCQHSQAGNSTLPDTLRTKANKTRVIVHTQLFSFARHNFPTSIGTSCLMYEMQLRKCFQTQWETP